MTDRGELLELQNRVARLEEQVARLTAILAEEAAAPAVPAPASPAAPVQVPTSATPPDDSFAEARALAAAGSKIHAIKVVREQTGMGLRQAKDLVDSW